MKRHLLPLLVLLAPAAFAIVDTNNNGLSDLWEKQYNQGELFPDTADYAPEADPDGDGWTNAQEAAAGTDPLSADSPDGFLRPETTYIPESWQDLDGDGILDHIPETITLQWPTIPGKQYTLLYSTDLTEGNWQALEAPYIGNGNVTEYGIPITQQDGTRPDLLFWRVSVEDVDSDGDSMTDSEESQFGSDPLSADTDSDGVNDSEEYQQGTDPHIPRIWGFREAPNSDGTVTYTWNSHAEHGDWFHLERQQPDGSWKTVYSTTYGTSELPYVSDVVSYTLTLDPATDYLP